MIQSRHAIENLVMHRDRVTVSSASCIIVANQGPVSTLQSAHVTLDRQSHPIEELVGTNHGKECRDQRSVKSR